MSPARRSNKRRDWPRGLRETRPGYYSWDHPDGRNLAIGRVSLAVAKNEAMLANQRVAEDRPGLLERIAGSANTLGKLIDMMPAPENKNTAKSLRSLDKIIRAELGSKQCASLITNDCAKLIRSIQAKGNGRTAQAVRSRLIVICQYGQEEGWLETNPASATRTADVEVQRSRLTLEDFKAIREKAPAISEWLAHAMNIAIVTGADRSTISALQRRDVGAEALTIRRSKTGVAVAIPLRIRLDVLGLDLSALVKHKTGVVSPYLLHHVHAWGNAPAGSLIHPDRISHAFTEARKLAGIPDTLPSGKKAPTFHEIRSLAKRLYTEQGNVDTKALLNHLSDSAAAIYADPRGVEPIKVRVS